jgi:chromosome segregation ATPase
VKELTGMPDLGNFPLNILYFKSFGLLPLFFLSSNPFNFKFFADEKAALEARHQDCVPSVDVAKQLDDRDAAHKAEADQLKGRIAELLDEKEQREGLLKKTRSLLTISETDASNTHAELDGLKEQATKWEVTVAQLNADLARKLQILSSFILSDIV